MLKSFWIIKKKEREREKTWETWGKALSNYSWFGGSWWWNIYITHRGLRSDSISRVAYRSYPTFFLAFLQKKSAKFSQSHSPARRSPGWPQRLDPSSDAVSGRRQKLCLNQHLLPVGTGRILLRVRAKRRGLLCEEKEWREEVMNDRY